NPNGNSSDFAVTNSIPLPSPLPELGVFVGSNCFPERNSLAGLLATAYCATISIQGSTSYSYSYGNFSSGFNPNKKSFPLAFTGTNISNSLGGSEGQYLGSPSGIGASLEPGGRTCNLLEAPQSATGSVPARRITSTSSSLRDFNSQIYFVSAYQGAFNTRTGFQRIFRESSSSSSSESGGANLFGNAECAAYAGSTGNRWRLIVGASLIPPTSSNTSSDSGVTASSECPIDLSPTLSRVFSESGSVASGSSQNVPISFVDWRPVQCSANLVVFQEKNYSGLASVSETRGIMEETIPASFITKILWQNNENVAANYPEISFENIQKEVSHELPLAYSVFVSANVFTEDVSVNIRKRLPVVNGNVLSWQYDNEFDQIGIALSIPIGNGIVLQAKYWNTN
ncbi:MAG: hypothetical protein ACRDBG_25050, partial [Waterburya sp.]